MPKDELFQTDASVFEALAGDDPFLQRSAAFTARDKKLAKAVPLLAPLLESENLGVQEAAELALKKIRGPESVRCVAPLLRSENPGVRNSAMSILRKIGGDDFKTLVDLTQDQDPDIRIFMADILGSVGSRVALEMLAKLVADESSNVRYQAAISLGMLGLPEAAGYLRSVLDDEEEWVRFAAVEALASIQDDSCVDIFIQALPSSSLLVASTIVDALGEMKNLKAVPLLLRSLDTTTGPLRNKEVKAIVNILGAKSLALLGEADVAKLKPYLMAALTDNDSEVVLAALKGLSVVGDAKGSKAVLKLIEGLDLERDQDMLAAASACLSSIGLNGDLSKALQSHNELVVRQAIEALGKIHSERSANVLIEAFDHLDRDMRRLSIEHLIHIASEEHIHFFESLLQKSEDADVIKKALYFLGNKMHRLRSAPLLLKFLTHQYNDVKEAALEACLGLEAPDVNEELAALADSPDLVQRMMGVYAMGRIDSELYLEGLTKALQDPEPDVRTVALNALSENAEAVEKHLDVLAPLLHDSSRQVRLALVETLQRSTSPRTVNMLLEALKDDDDWVKIRAAESLAACREHTAVPQLVGMLYETSPMVQIKIINALSLIGGNLAFRALLEAAASDDPEIQEAAAEAVARISKAHREDI